MKLHLHLRTEYFNEVKRGNKVFEYRLAKKYWADRLYMRSYESIVIYNAYKPGAENRIEIPYRGFNIQTINHKHFGPDDVSVYAIYLSAAGLRPEESK